MSNLFLSSAHGPSAGDGDKVRDTIQPIDNDREPAELDNTPTIAIQRTDDSPELTGLTDRQVAGDEHPSEKYAPWWKTVAVEPHNILIDRQVATSGTASQRESAGEFGSGTTQYQVSITPELREGMELGGDYFLSTDKVVQEGASLTLTPAVQDSEWAAVSQRLGTKNARSAYQATLYSNLLRSL